MREQVESIGNEAVRLIAAAGDLQALDAVRVALLGRQGKLTLLLRGLGSLSPEERPAAGAAANAVRIRIEEALAQRKQELEVAAAAAKQAEAVLDVTIPGKRPVVGHQHPLTQVMEDVFAIFTSLGFDVVEGREVEEYYYNFEALNYPPGHPAIDETDTYYVTDDVQLRSQTSAAQIKVMRERTPNPMQVVVPGRVYRRESVTMTHSDMFHQLEGMAVGPNVGMAHLRGTLESFVHLYYGPGTRIRIRPDFFPFVEPGGDVSVNCVFCNAEGCKFCKYSGWVEIGGCGVVHPNVLRAGGYDPEVVSGFAFGMGLDRLAQRRFGIDQIRVLFENDMRVVEQF